MVATAGALDAVRAAVPAGIAERVLDHGVIMPAFIDAHQHAFLVAVDSYTDVLYRRGSDIAGLLTKLSTLVASAPKDTETPWLRFHGYQPLTLTEHRSPTATHSTPYCPDRPLHVISRTYHESAVNSAGLAALGINSATPDPPGGRIAKDRRGRPTGILLEAGSFEAETASRPPRSDRELAEEVGGLWRTLGRPGDLPYR